MSTPLEAQTLIGVDTHYRDLGLWGSGLVPETSAGHTEEGRRQADSRFLVANSNWEHQSTAKIPSSTHPLGQI